MSNGRAYGVTDVSLKFDPFDVQLHAVEVIPRRRSGADSTAQIY